MLRSDISKLKGIDIFKTVVRYLAGVSYKETWEIKLTFPNFINSKTNKSNNS